MAKTKIDVEVNDWLCSARKIEKTYKNYDGLGYRIIAQLTLDDNNEYAVKARVSSRYYELGTFEQTPTGSKLSFKAPTERIYTSGDTPSKVNAKLKTRNINVDVQSIENRYLEYIVNRYNNRINRTKHDKARELFDIRKKDFLKELKALEEKHGVRLDCSVYMHDYDEYDIDIEIIDTASDYEFQDSLEDEDVKGILYE